MTTPYTVLIGQPLGEPTRTPIVPLAEALGGTGNAGGQPSGLEPSGDATCVTDTANLQNALIALPAGSTLQLSAGTFYLNPIVPVANQAARVVGQGEQATFLVWNTSTAAVAFTGNTGFQRFNLERLSLTQNGTGDLLAIDTATGTRLPQFTFIDCSFTLGPSNTGGYLINATGPANSSAMANCFYLRCVWTINAATRTVPGITITATSGGGISNCTWEKCDFNYGLQTSADNTQYFVYIAALSAGNAAFHANMTFRDCRWEHPFGGAIQSMSGRSLSIENNTFWDLSVASSPALGNSLIYIGSTSGQLVSTGTRITGCLRDLGLTTGANAGTGVWDIYTESTVAQTVIESYATAPGFHTSSDPAYFNFNSCPSVTITNPQSSGATDSATYQISNPPVQLTQPAALPAASIWLPSDLGYVATAFDPVFQVTSATRLITAGVLNLIGLQIRGTSSPGHVDLDVGGAGGTLTSGQCLIGLYNSAGTLLGSSADQSGVWTSAGFKNGTALSPQAAGTLTNIPAGPYWIALLGNGTTMPSFTVAGGNQNSSAFILNSQTTNATARYATNGSSLTALPITITPGSNSKQQIAAWWAALY